MKDALRYFGISRVKESTTSARRSHLSTLRTRPDKFILTRTDVRRLRLTVSLCRENECPRFRGDDGRRFRDQPVPVTRDRHEEQTTRSLCIQLPLFGVNPKRTPSCRGCFYFGDSV